MKFGFGYDEPKVQPEHGLYHPRFMGRDSPERALKDHLDEYRSSQSPQKQTIAILFYRCYYLSGNTAFVDALIDEVEALGCNAIGLFSNTLRDEQQCDNVNGKAVQRFPIALTHLMNMETGKCQVDVIITTMAFATGEVNPDGPTLGSWSTAGLSALDVPILQAINSLAIRESWEASTRGLDPLDTAMNVAIPEFDGRIITVPISFKAPQDENSAVLYYEPVPDRVSQVAKQACRFGALKHKLNRDKRIAFVLTNSSSKAQRIGDAVGLDTPESIIRVFEAMKKAGYDLGASIPNDGDKVVKDLIGRCSYDEIYLTQEQLANAAGQVPKQVYQKLFDSLPASQKKHMVDQWGTPPGEAYVHNDSIALAGLEFGNVFLALQPPRGYGMDPDKIYHTPDLAPPHNYYALYSWLREEWKADAIVHMGKHGTLEWLPGKGIGLSSSCYPDSFLDDMPLIYPFIINDPGEGTQSKRRSHAVIIDHMTPPITTADSYSELAQLMQLVDEYYRIEMLDPTKLPLIQNQIWELVKKVNLDEDLALLHQGRSEEGDDHDHKHNHTHTDADNHEYGHEHAHGHEHGHKDEPHDHAHDHGQKDEHAHDHDHTDERHHEHGHNDHRGAKESIDDSTAKEHEHDHDRHHHNEDDHDHEHFHQLKESSLAGMDGKDVAHLIEDMDGYLCELAGAQIRDGLHVFGKIPEGEALVDTLHALTRLSNLEVPSLRDAVAELFEVTYSDLLSNQGAKLNEVPSSLMDLADRPLFTAGDVVEIVDELSKHLLALLIQRQFDDSRIPHVIDETFSRAVNAAESIKIVEVLSFVCNTLEPALRGTTDEITNLIAALNGSFVAGGPSGSPTRGMAHILPTGRNFYSVDPNAIPSMPAWEVGRGLAREVLARYIKETGAYPEHVAISVWGTAAMRTHGDDIAEILALLGIRPKWAKENHRVEGLELIPVSELGHPRVDVTIRISGFFRDAFPHLITLLDEAVNMAINADEPPEENFIRKHFLEDLASNAIEEESARYRVFGCPPGAYGIGILDLIEAQNWKDDADFAKCYITWGGYAYSRGNPEGTTAHEEFTRRLTTVEVAIHNQDDREHDIFDSDDYFQFHGGMIATIRALSGRQPRGYFGDTQDPATPKVRDIKEETLRVYRTRVVNPKWLDSIRKHGYKGASEMAATVDYLFGFDATANVVSDFMYEQVAQEYAFSKVTQDFFEESNPWALRGISERLLEAVQRGLWEDPKPETVEKLKQTLLKAEADLEGRNDPPQAS